MFFRKCYFIFSQAIKIELDRLKPSVDNVETERLATMKRANQNQQDQVRRVIDKLREEWAQVGHLSFCFNNEVKSLHFI